MRPVLLLATGNRGKVEEMRRIIGERYELRCIKDYDGIVMPEEDGFTFAQNAMKKALSVASQSGVPSLADDSGLEVYALGGEPGVLSARYGGELARNDEERYRLLLSRLEGVDDEQRKARFVSVVALAVPGGLVAIEEGFCEGRIIREPKGSNGFGYDPIFVPDGREQTYAELSGEDKNSLSHRYKAIAAILPHIVRLLG